MPSIQALAWEDLIKLAPKEADRINGPTNSQATLRLFGKPEDSVRVTLYRDHHAWCPYCQKIWLWLELKQIPYCIKKITMRCYGKKEDWYLKKVPTGMLPALELDSHLICESDLILLTLEEVFGPLGMPLRHPETQRLRNLERQLFGAWCKWLCTPRMNPREESQGKSHFQRLARKMEECLTSKEGPWINPSQLDENTNIPSGADVIFIPYLERMNASLAYYKGIFIRQEHPAINKWFQALEQLQVYRGTQSDFHTHAHDLPPQMGGCWVDPNPKQQLIAKAVDSGEGLGDQETSWNSSIESKESSPERIALARVLKHRHKLLELNPIGAEIFDQPLRAALTRMVYREVCKPINGSALGLRYLRDRISVPRDMPLLAARAFRQALEETALIDGPETAIAIPIKNRFDQNPEPFLTSLGK